jgi:hypothetical protein
MHQLPVRPANSSLRYALLGCFARLAGQEPISDVRRRNRSSIHSVPSQAIEDSLFPDADGDAMMISSASPFIMWSASDAHLFYLGADGVLPVSCEDCSITLSDVELLVDVELDDNVLDGWTGYKVRMSQCWDSSLYVLWDAISC